MSSKTNNITISKVKRVATIAVKSYFGYKILYYLILGCVPIAHDIHVKFYAAYDDIVPVDTPKSITPVREIHGVHSFNDMQPIIEDIVDEAIIFRNYHDCKSKFENVLYPRRKDHKDSFIVSDVDPDVRGNLYAAGISITNETVDRSLKDMLTEASPNNYASFMQIFEQEDYRYLLNVDNETKFLVDSSFISHFRHALVSTSVHSSYGVDTYSVQCFGVKSWLFYSVKDLEKYGFNPLPAPHGVIINGSPDSLSRVPSKRAIMYPGDVMYFPAFYYHAVATSPGKNLMFAIRRFSIKSLKKSFKASVRCTLLAILRHKVRQYYDRYYGKEKLGFTIRPADDYTPFKSSYDNDIFRKQKQIFKHVDGLSDFELPETW